ncbi:hypothetical protein BM1_07342 [Bipolaris maydis]|nr:hypothetical protein BM1_07342 [Bipolaris maydis]
MTEYSAEEEVETKITGVGVITTAEELSVTLNLVLDPVQLDLTFFDVTTGAEELGLTLVLVLEPVQLDWIVVGETGGDDRLTLPYPAPTGSSHLPYPFRH